MSDTIAPTPPTPTSAETVSSDPARAPESLTLDVVVTRAGHVESRHRVHAAVVRADGTRIARAHDADLLTWWRSCAKPFQVLPMLLDGSFDALGWGEEELALACASHGSEPEHVEIAARMLASVGLSAADLACGPHEPLSERGATILRAEHRKPTRLHSNCSGKHAAMLAHSVQRGWPTAGYETLSHEVQQQAWHTVAHWSGLDTSEIARGVDGCGVTVFSLPLHNMALAYARLSQAARDGEVAPARVVRAMTTQPHLVGGTDRFDTLLMRAGEGRIIAKVGAEGVHSVGLIDQGIGIAVKVEDGAPRAQYPAVLACLQALGALPSRLPEPLASIALQPIVNTRQEVVGRIFVPGHEVLMHD